VDGHRRQRIVRLRSSERRGLGLAARCIRGPSWRRGGRSLRPASKPLEDPARPGPSRETKRARRSSSPSRRSPGMCRSDLPHEAMTSATSAGSTPKRARTSSGPEAAFAPIVSRQPSCVRRPAASCPFPGDERRSASGGGGLRGGVPDHVVGLHDPRPRITGKRTRRRSANVADLRPQLVRQGRTGFWL